MSPGVLTNLEIPTTCVWNTGEVLCQNLVGKVPYDVTIQVPGAFDHRIPVTNIHKEKEKRKFLRDIQDDDMAVCMSTVFGLDEIDKGLLLQSLDMKFSMGADKVFIYGSYDNAPEVQELIDGLTGPSVQVLDWVLPDVITPGIYHNAVKGKKNCSRYNAQPLQYLDCQYRNMYKYRYLAVIDLDEFIFPMETSIDSVAMLDDISARNNHQVATFMFFFYESCFYNEMFEGLQLRRWAHRAYLHTSIWVPYTFKCIHRPELVTYIRIHRYKGLLDGMFSTIVSPSEGNLYHFHRKCYSAEQPIKLPQIGLHPRDDVIDLYLNRTDKHLELNPRQKHE